MSLLFWLSNMLKPIHKSCSVDFAQQFKEILSEWQEKIPRLTRLLGCYVEFKTGNRNLSPYKSHNYFEIFRHYVSPNFRKSIYFFLSRTVAIHKTAGEGGYFFKSSQPLLPASQTLRHQPSNYCREFTSAESAAGLELGIFGFRAQVANH